MLKDVVQRFLSNSIQSRCDGWEKLIRWFLTLENHMNPGGSIEAVYEFFDRPRESSRVILELGEHEVAPAYLDTAAVVDLEGD